MATGNLQIARAWCPACGTHRKAERPAPVWGCGDLAMVVATSGLWFLVRLLTAPAWRCSTCGTKVDP